MADILQDVPIRAERERVFGAVSRPEGLDRWWTKESSGTPALGEEYALGFGPRHQWRATVSHCVSGSEFELELVQADPDWQGTRVRFQLERRDAATWVRFSHTG